jgi:hypothetical protein
MEFVAALGFSLASCVDDLRAASIALSGDSFRLRRFGAIDLLASDPTGLNAATPEHDQDPAPFYLFDGQFSAGTQYFHTLLEAPAGELRRRIDALLEDRGGSDEVNAGLFVVGRIDRDRLQLLTDCLSQYPLYYFRCGERFIVSNVLQHIAAVLIACGLPATPSLLPCLEGTVFGGVLRDSTHFAEIERLPFEHMMVADPQLRLRRLKATDRKLSYEETISEARSALARHVQSVAGAVAAPRLVATDLTGGRDSRLVLSILLDSPLRGEINARCFTRYPHPDANVAGALIAAYGLSLARLPVVVDADPRFWRQGLARRGIQANAALSGGARVLAGASSTVALPNFVHFTGFFGELSGASSSCDFLSHTEHHGYSAARAVDSMLANRRSVGALDLISAEGTAIARDNAIAALTEIEQEGVAHEHLQAEFYLRTRCRSHFGLLSWLSNQSKIAPEPLSSPWLDQARRLLPRRLYREGKVTLDLLLAGGRRDLALIPLAEKTWAPSIIPARELEAFGRIAPITAASAPLSAHTGSLMGASSFLSRSARRLLQDPVVSHDMRSRAPHPSPDGQTRIANEGLIESSQAVLREVLERTVARDDIWSLLDREAAIHYAHLTKDAFRSTIDAGALGQVVSGICWILDQPALMGITESAWMTTDTELSSDRV